MTTGYCCGCDVPIESDYCPRCKENMGRWNPDEAIQGPQTRLEKQFADRIAEVIGGVVERRRAA